jgi:aryl-alcohol dehydrogenase (NADP+)
VVSHPAITAAIMGPRTVEQLVDTLAGASVELDDDVLDAIDAIVAPGSTVNPEDIRNNARAIAESPLRRRPVGSRSAA